MLEPLTSQEIPKPSQAFKNKKSQKIINEINSALGEQNFSQAHLLMTKLKKIDPNPLINIRIAHLMYIMKKYLEAESIYLNLLKTLPEDYKPEIYFGLGQVYYELNRFAESHFAYSSVLLRSPDYKQAGYIYLRLGKIFLTLQDYESSLYYLKTIIKRQKSSSLIISQAAALISHIYLNQKKPVLALALSKEAVKVQTSFEAITGLVLIILHSKPKQAEKLCVRVLSKDLNKREWNVCMLIRALISIKLGKFELSINILENDVKSSEIENLKFQLLGVAFYYFGDKVRALEAFRKCRKIPAVNDEEINNLQNLAKVFWELGLKFEAYVCVNEIAWARNGDRVEVEDLVVKVPEIGLMRLIE